MLPALAQIGPFLGGVGLNIIAASIAAWLTLFLYHRRNIDAQWIDTIQKIYVEFWHDEKVSRAQDDRQR